MGDDARKLFRELERQGFTVERTKGSHWLVRNSEGRAVCTIAGTASDWRSLRNAISQLRKAGFIWPHR